MISPEDIREQYAEEYVDTKKNVLDYPTELSGYSLELNPYCSHCPKFDCDCATMYADNLVYNTIIFCANRGKCQGILAALHDSEELHNDPILRNAIFRNIINAAL